VVDIFKNALAPVQTALHRRHILTDLRSVSVEQKSVGDVGSQNAIDFFARYPDKIDAYQGY